MQTPLKSPHLKTSMFLSFDEISLMEDRHQIWSDVQDKGVRQTSFETRNDGKVLIGFHPVHDGVFMMEFKSRISHCQPLDWNNLKLFMEDGSKLIVDMDETGLVSIKSDEITSKTIQGIHQ